MTTKENIYESESLIVSDGCCVQYGEALAIDDVTFSITKGKKIAVVGPNGCLLYTSPSPRDLP